MFKTAVAARVMLAMLLATTLAGCATLRSATELPPPPPPPPPTPPPPPPTSPESVVGAIHVSGTGAAKFYYLPDYIFTSLGASDAARAARVAGTRFYGPRYGSQDVPGVVDTTYIFLPVCRGKVDVAHLAPRQLTAQGQQEVSLTCPI